MVEAVNPPEGHRVRPRPTFPGYKRAYEYHPTADITAPELAAVFEFVMAAITGAPPQFLDMLWESVDDTVRRHFKVEQKSSIVIPH